jgi:hypothetical protein
VQWVSWVELVMCLYVAFSLCVVSLLPCFDTFLPSMLAFVLYLLVRLLGREILFSPVEVGFEILICHPTVVRVGLSFELLVDFLFLAIR